MENSKDYVKYIFVILLVFVIYFAYLIVKPFITAILTSCLIAYLFYPLYTSLNRRIHRRNLSAFIISVFIIILLAVPFILMLNAMAKESQFVYIKAKQIFVTGDIFNIGCAEDDTSTGCRLSNWLGSFVTKPSVRYHLDESINRITTTISQKVSALVFSVPAIIMNIFVTLFATFYLFRDGKAIVEKIKGLLPLKLHHQKQLFQQLDEATYAIVYGSLLIAAIQGVVGAIGFYFFGISSPIMWGMLVAVFALLPFVGTAIIWLPLSLVVIFQGFSTDSSSAIFTGIGLLLYGALIIASIDNFLKPYIIGRGARIHPVLVLLGVLGGLAFFGFIGLVIGPLVLAIASTLLEIYETEKAEGDGIKV